MIEQDKSLDALRAAIDEDQERELEEEEKSSENQEASDEEGTSTEPTEEEPSEGNSEQDEWLVPGRFKTQDDLLKAYKELESFTGKQSSEIQQLRNVQQRSQPQQQSETPEQKHKRLSRFAEQIQEDPEKAIKEIVNKEWQQKSESQKAASFKREYLERKKNPEFQELEPIMTNIAMQYQDVINNSPNLKNNPLVLDMLEYVAKGIKAEEMASKAKNDGVKKGQDLHRKKQKAKVEGSSGTKKKRKIDISKLSSEEIKKKINKGELEI